MQNSQYSHCFLNGYLTQMASTKTKCPNFKIWKLAFNNPHGTNMMCHDLWPITFPCNDVWHPYTYRLWIVLRCSASAWALYSLQSVCWSPRSENLSSSWQLEGHFWTGFVSVHALYFCFSIGQPLFSIEYFPTKLGGGEFLNSCMHEMMSINFLIFPIGKFQKTCTNFLFKEEFQLLSFRIRIKHSTDWPKGITHNPPAKMPYF